MAQPYTNDPEHERSKHLLAHLEEMHALKEAEDLMRFATTEPDRSSDARITDELPQIHADLAEDNTTTDRPATYNLLEPQVAGVNYAVVLEAVDAWHLDLTVKKVWEQPDGNPGETSLTLNSYDPLFQREEAQAEHEGLLQAFEQHGLETMMNRAELLAVEHDYLDGKREDLRLFTEGPPDRFQTLAQRLEGEIYPDLNPTEQHEHLEMETWDAWLDTVQAVQSIQPDAMGHYWNTYFRPVENTDGQALGTALFITEYPQLPADFDPGDAGPGVYDSVYPTEARTLEMAHFATTDDAQQFDEEFRSYLIPGLLNGPELAPEVARLEGLSGVWQPLNHDEIVNLMSKNDPVIREDSQWHLHDPYAEQTTRLEAEGLHGDPLAAQIEAEANQSRSEIGIDERHDVSALPLPERDI